MEERRRVVVATVANRLRRLGVGEWQSVAEQAGTWDVAVAVDMLKTAGQLESWVLWTLSLLLDTAIPTPQPYMSTARIFETPPTI